MTKPKGLVALHKASVSAIFDHAEMLSRGASLRGRDYVYIRGDSRLPLLVCHADTVHKQEPSVIVFDGKRNSLKSPTGLGADDRAGVYASLQLWNSLNPSPGLLITDGEEIGGVGAREAAETLREELKIYPFFVEIDRQGKGEAVYYNEEPQGFKKYIQSFGFKEKRGLFSDVSILGNQLQKCSVNLSAGYYGAHTEEEYLIIHHLEYTIKRVNRLILHTLENPQRFKLPKQRKRKNRHSARYWYGLDINDADLYALFADRENDSTSHSDFPPCDTFDQFLRNQEAATRPPSYEFGICDYCGAHSELFPTPQYGKVCVRCFADFEMR